MVRLSSARLVRLVAVLALMASAGPVLAGPTPVISILSNQGMAPFAVHVHALNSSYSTGDQLTSLIAWDFGDASGTYNQLNGFNAAHLYESPGTYTLKLTITDKAGAQASVTQQITITSDTRTPVYVSAAGNDNNNGLTEATAIKTVAKAQSILGNNKKVLFRRGDTFNLGVQFNPNQTNLVIGAYGSGTRPVLYWTGGGGSGSYPAIINMGWSNSAVVIQELKFDSAGPPTQTSPRGIHPHGTNITVKSCDFMDVSDALNGDSTALLTINNTAGVTGGYFCWDQGTDHTHLGNVTTDSNNEHTLRLGGETRMLAAFNDFTNHTKSTVWCMLGSDAYLYRNKFREGRVAVGPNPYAGGQSERFKRFVADGNEFFDEGFQILPGAENVVIRNNVVHSNALESVSIWGWSSSMNRTATDIRVFCNTGTNDHNLYGKFLKIGAGAVNVQAIDNLFVSPDLNTGYGASNVNSDDPNLNSHTMTNNLWSNPHIGTAVHFLAGVGKNVSQWDALPETTNEQYKTFSYSDLDGNNKPTFNAAVGTTIAGVHVDFNGNLRPTGGSWTVGAVELNPGGGGGPPPPPPPPPPGDSEIVYDFETSAGWTVPMAQNLADGAWERGVPAGYGDRGDPTTDYDGSGQCWLTGNRPGNSDVDGGPTVLVSPTLSLAGTDPIIRYARWFWCTEPPYDNDYMVVGVSNDGGSNWATVESVAHSEGWHLHGFRVADYVTPTNSVKVRFSVADNPNDSVTEAAIDDFHICFSGCSPSGVYGDLNGDGLVDSTDLLIILNVWGPCSNCAADLNHSGVVDTEDLLLLLSAWS